ncbi:MAG: UPF0149 family protein [Proteobacteria bacterium]|nr:UPF0149 family protein [Pseudomonadota bacterium]
MPDDDRLPEHAAVAAALRAAGVAVDVSELHGSLCGYVAGGGRAEAADWLARLHADDGRDGDLGEPLERLRAATLAQFDREGFALDVLLPGDDAGLPDRADAMLAWCRGFLGGFGLAAPAERLLSAESAEALQDLGRIAASDLGYEGNEEDEDALSEIVEFVGMAPLLIHADCVRAAERRRKAH